MLRTHLSSPVRCSGLDSISRQMLLTKMAMSEPQSRPARYSVGILGVPGQYSALGQYFTSLFLFVQFFIVFVCGILNIG